MSLYYTPEYAKVGDVIPFFDRRSGRFENFYLKNWNPDVPKELVTYGWHRMSGAWPDRIEETPVHILGGTGSVVEVDGTYHLFYCTFADNPQRQWVRHAISEDLTHWHEIGEAFGPDTAIYEPTDWRDPFVFWNEDERCWWMLVAARRRASSGRNGCVGLCVSDDLLHWRAEGPVYAPDIHPAAYECPDMFRMGDWWYLVFSNYTDGFATYYRMSRSPRGPWVRPAIDTFDSRAFYAAKTGSDGDSRYLFGWAPTRGENSWGFDPSAEYGADYRTWNWGGSMVVHRLVQHADGTLGTAPSGDVTERLASARMQPVRLCPVQGQWRVEGGPVVGSSQGFAAAVGCPMPECGVISARVRYSGDPVRFGLMMHVDESLTDGYYLQFDPRHQRIEWRSGLRMHERGGQLFPYAVEMERPCVLEEGREYLVEVFVDSSQAHLYLDRDYTFGMRLYDRRPGSVGWYVESGALEVARMHVATL